MKATEILMEEHRVIERVLAALEAASQHLEQGQPVRTGFFLDAAQFVQGFADGCHHLKEEKVLFKTMAEYGVPVQGGPIGMMLAEHEQGRAYIRALRQTAQLVEAGNRAALAEIVLNARCYATLLRYHIAKEDRILFQIADQAIPTWRQAQLLDEFEHVEHEEAGAGVHEKYLALAAALEREAGLQPQIAS